jgi:hypothetical protein
VINIRKETSQFFYIDVQAMRSTTAMKVQKATYKFEQVFSLESFFFFVAVGTDELWPERMSFVRSLYVASALISLSK